MDAQTLTAMLRAERPPLLMPEGGVADLRRRVAESALLGRWLGWVRRRADELASGPSVAEIAKRPTAASRMLMERLQALSLSYLLTDEACYLDAAVRELAGAAADETIWFGLRPEFDLQTSETATACCIALDWLGANVPADVRAEVHDALVERSLQAALAVYASTVGHRWSARRNNWNQVCNGGAILSALTLAGARPELAAQVLGEALRSLPLAMAEFAPDGASEEGPMYWRYGTLWNCLALAALDTMLGTTFGLDNCPGLRETAEFYIHSTGPVGKAFNYSDCSTPVLASPQILWLARRFGRADIALAERRVVEWAASGELEVTGTTHEHGLEGYPVHPLDVVWWDPAWDELEEPTWPTDAVFGRQEVVLMRSAWNDTDALFVGFKGGVCLRHHGHMDVGSFVFDALGRRWAHDLGSDSYSLPGYFESWDGSSYRFYSFYRIRPEGHNTLVINPHIQPQQDLDAHAPIIASGFAPDRAFAVCDMSAQYHRQAQSVVRGVALTDGRTRLLVQDEVRSDRAVDLWWFLHTRAEIEVAGDGRSAMLVDGDARLCVQMVSDVHGEFFEMPCEPMVHSPNPPGQSPNQGYRKLAFRSEVAVNPTLAVRLTPLREGQPVPEAPADSIIPLAQWTEQETDR